MAGGYSRSVSSMNQRELQRLVAVRAACASGEARARRLGARLTQGELASTLGVAQSTVALWESGHRTPRGEAALRYADLLDTLPALDAPGVSA